MKGHKWCPQCYPPKGEVVATAYLWGHGGACMPLRHWMERVGAEYSPDACDVATDAGFRGIHDCEDWCVAAPLDRAEAAEVESLLDSLTRFDDAVEGWEVKR